MDKSEWRKLYSKMRYRILHRQDYSDIVEDWIYHRAVQDERDTKFTFTSRSQIKRWSSIAGNTRIIEIGDEEKRITSGGMEADVQVSIIQSPKSLWSDPKLAKIGQIAVSDSTEKAFGSCSQREASAEYEEDLAISR